MRGEFQAELDEVSALLVAMADEVRSAMKRATTALLTVDAGIAGGVITGDAAVNQLHKEVEEKVYALMARQAPVASDLRLVVSALHIASDFERMGDLAKHVAKTALRRHPNRAVPDELTKVIQDMANVADRIPQLNQLRDLAGEAVDGLRAGDVSSLGAAMCKGWQAKRTLASGVSTQQIDVAVEAALEAGASGAKVTGAGGGGFLLVVCPVENQRAVRDRLADMKELPINLEPHGSRVIFNVHRDIWI